MYLYKIESEPELGNPTLKKNSIIDFSRGGGSSIYIEGGWGAQEDAFRWTILDEASIEFKN